MAEEEVKKTEEAPDKPSGGMGKLPLMIGGGVLILVVLGVGGFFAAKAFSAPSDAAETDTAVELTEDGEPVFESTGIYYQGFDSFITVLRTSDEYHFTYLKFVPQFECEDAAVLSEISSKLPQIESKINSIMTDLDWTSIRSEKGREKQADRLRDKLNELLEEGKIIKVYFTTFVTQ